MYHIRTPVKTGVSIWETENVRYEWQDKAGGYGIQTEFGRRAVKEIRGDYYNVMGLPIHLVKKMLKEIGVL